MYKRLSIIMFPFMLVAFIGAAIWGYLEHREKNTILIKAENQYQRAFHDLSFRMDKLHTELGNTLAVNSTSQDSYRKGLVNVWRITSQAQSDINQLPLSLLPFNKTEEFLANLANFSYRTSVRDLIKQPLTEEEMNTLNALYAHAKELTTEIRGVQEKVLANNLRWMDVEVALLSQKENNDNTIIDGFQTVDKKVGEYSEINWGPGSPSIFQKNNVEMLSGKEMTSDEIKQKAAQFINQSDTSGFQVVENGKAGTEYQSYSVIVANGSNPEDAIQMDFTKKGGELIYFMNSRSIPTASIDVRQARDIANEYLDNHGYTDMSAVSYDQYQNVANIIFAKRQEGVTIYPMSISVKVALDNGEVTGVQATDYVFAQKERKLGAPKLSVDEAKKTLNPKLEVSDQTLAIIRNDINEEVLCHEFIGTMNGNLYRIYINGETGTEEKIETIREDQKEAAASS
jgi:spore germination protein